MVLARVMAWEIGRCNICNGLCFDVYGLYEVRSLPTDVKLALKYLPRVLFVCRWRLQSHDSCDKIEFEYMVDNEFYAIKVTYP